MSASDSSNSGWEDARRAALDDLLRLLSSVPTGTRVLDLGSDHSDRLTALARLGFDIYALTPDEKTARAVADRFHRHGFGACSAGRVARAAAGGVPQPVGAGWLVRVVDEDRQASFAALNGARSQLASGGWAYVVFRCDPARADVAAPEGGWAVARRPAPLTSGWIQAVYRRVDVGTPP